VYDVVKIQVISSQPLTIAEQIVEGEKRLKEIAKELKEIEAKNKNRCRTTLSS
jgi:hypothetical protein